jgi:hypothetical protein
MPATSTRVLRMGVAIAFAVAAAISEVLGLVLSVWDARRVERAFARHWPNRPPGVLEPAPTLGDLAALVPLFDEVARPPRGFRRWRGPLLFGVGAILALCSTVITSVD